MGYSDNGLRAAEAKGNILVFPTEPLAAFAPCPEFILAPRRMRKILIENEDSSWNHPTMHGFQNIQRT